MGSEARAPPVFVISGEAGSGFSCFDNTSFLDGCIIFFALPSSGDCVRCVFFECSLTHSLIHLLTRLTNNHKPVLEGEIREDEGGFIGLHTPAGAEVGRVYRNGLKRWLQSLMPDCGP